MRVRAKLTAMAESEILSMLNYGEYLRIKSFDPKPLFRAYVVGHEGEFTPTAVGIGPIVTKWFETAIRKLKDQIQFGTKLFLGHSISNRHENRTSVGEIVGTALKTIKDKLSVVAIAYIRPEYRDLKLDIASIEADVELLVDKEKGTYDAEVKDITGVALGNSSEEKPAFTGATLIGEIQAFLTQSQQYNQGGDMEITIADVRQFVSTGKLKPSDIFGLQDLTGDPMVAAHIESEVKEKKSGDWYHRQRDKEKFEQEIETLKKTHETEKGILTKERDDLRKDVMTGKVPILVTKIKEERKLDDKQNAFIDRTISKFSPEKLDDLEKGLNSFFDDQIKEFKELSESVFGEKKPDPKSGNGQGGDPKPEPVSPQISEMSLE